MSSDLVLRFDRFELQLAERRLLRDGEPVPLRGRAFDLLVVLAERAGRLVTKEELLDLVWPGLVVEENNIAAQVVALRKALYSELIVTVPGRGYRFAARANATATATADVSGAMAESAFAPPAPQRLFGRDGDLTRLRASLQLPGCVTLVGPSGVGKTSLALAMLAEWGARRADAAAALWLDLAALSDDSQLWPALCRALGSDLDGDAATALAAALGHAPRLLVLDNAEHLIDAVAGLVRLLVGAAPALHILVTSQAPLATGGERVERVDPLALAPVEVSDAQALQSSALAMFVDRVRMADPRFRFAPESMPVLRRLCASLDGLPLALEMAAARVPLLGLQRVHEGLAERFSMLRQHQRDAPRRHRTLASALDWSHDLLAPEEQRLFRALGVFSGGFTLDLAVTVAGDPAESAWETIDRIAVLVERSLVVGNHEDPPRYSMLETMRSYALAKLAASGEMFAVRARETVALRRLIARANQALQEAGDPTLPGTGVNEMNNVRETLTWARHHDPVAAVALSIDAAGLASFSPWRREATGWLAACEPLLALPGVDQQLQAAWWRRRATDLLFDGDPGAADAARRAIDLCRSVGDDWLLFWALVVLARVQTSARAERDAAGDEMSDLLARHPEWPANAQVVATGTLALLCGAHEDHEGMLRHRLVELDHARRVGLLMHVGAAENNVAYALSRLGRHAEALDRLRAYLGSAAGEAAVNTLHARMLAMRIQLTLGQVDAALADAVDTMVACRRHGVSGVADFAAMAAVRAGRPRAAAMLLGRARAGYASRATPEPTDARSDFEVARILIQEQLDPATLDRLEARGRQLDDAEADHLLFAKDDVS